MFNVHRLDKFGNQSFYIRVRQPGLQDGILAVDVQLLRRSQAQSEHATQSVRDQIQSLFEEPSLDKYVIRSSPKQP